MTPPPLDAGPGALMHGLSRSTIFLVLRVLFLFSMIPAALLAVSNDVAASIFVEVMHIVGAVCVVGARQRFGRTTNA